MLPRYQPQSQLKIFEEILDLESHKPVNISIIDDLIFVKLEAKDKSATCPRCGCKSHKLHQNHEHLVQDMPWNGKAVYLQINSRQFKCDKCGKPFTETLEMKPFRRGYTKRFALDIVDRVLSSNILAVAEQTSLSEYQIQNILNDVGKLLRNQIPKNLVKLGIDEISLRKGSGRYCAVLVDLDRHEIIGLLKSRKQDEIREVLMSWGDEVLNSIKLVSMDLSSSYKSIINEVLPEVEIVADRFHVMKQINDELDSKRKKEKRKATAEAEKARSKAKKKEKEEIEDALKGSKYPLLKNEVDLLNEQKEKLEKVKEVSPILAQMHNLKEEFRTIFEKSQNWGEGTLELMDWIEKASNVYSKSCQTLINWFGEVTGYFEHHISNGCVEGLNNKLKVIKRCGYGFRNFENFELRVLLSCTKSIDFAY
jgi:transposase